MRHLALAGSLLLLSLLACNDDRQLLGPNFAAISTPAGFTANPVAFNQIDLAWQNNSKNESGFEIHRSTTGAGGTFTLLGSTGPGITSYGDGGLTASTQYCYKARAFKNSGPNKTYSPFSGVACATTLVVPRPAAPSAVNATPQFGYVFSVTWSDNSANETGFRVERAATSTGPWTAVNTTGPNGTSFSDYQIPTAEQQVCYRVFAVNSYGDSDPSNVDCTAMPAAPTDLAAAVAADGSVDLTWTDNSTVEQGYEVQRYDAVTYWSVVATLAAGVTSYHDAGVAPNNTYGYLVRATRDGGGSANSNYVTAVTATAPPSAPENVDAVPYGADPYGYSSRVVLVTWLDASANEAGFRVERSNDGGTSWSVAITTGPDETAFWDYEVPSEQSVCYRVFAVNNKGDSPASNMDCTTPPAAPSDFSATGVDATTVDFAWTDNSAVEDGYWIGIDYGNGYWEIIASVDANTTSYRLQWDYAYYYTYFAVAIKDGGYSDWSNEAYPSAPPSSSSVGAVTTSHPLTPRAAPRPVVRKGGNP